MDHKPTKCIDCTYYLGNFTCEAFPRGIPDEILTGEVRDTDNYPERILEVDCAIQ
jgi:hypothetical protein